MFNVDLSLSELQKLFENQGIDIIVRSYDVSMSHNLVEQPSIDISVDCIGLLQSTKEVK